MILPKYNVIYYKEILDRCFRKFFVDYNDYFSKTDSIYILNKALSKTNIKKIFTDYILEEINNIVTPYDLINSPNFYIIINGCKPNNNLMLKYKDNKYFPKKIELLINKDFQLKYWIKETDIKIDLIKFNECFIEIFNTLFNIKKFKYKKYIIPKNLILIQHNNLDCWMIFKVIKHIYGNKNVVNLVKHVNEKDKILIALNDLICKYIKNKKDISNLKEFKLAYNEIKQFLANKIENININD